ncbi:hypothetical protein SDJN02_19932, partial [Cucurbita argyrosperma subsp. argyrosperma]
MPSEFYRMKSHAKVRTRCSTGRANLLRSSNWQHFLGIIDVRFLHDPSCILFKFLAILINFYELFSPQVGRFCKMDRDSKNERVEREKKKNDTLVREIIQQ